MALWRTGCCAVRAVRSSVLASPDAEENCQGYDCSGFATYEKSRLCKADAGSNLNNYRSAHAAVVGIASDVCQMQEAQLRLRMCATCGSRNCYPKKISTVYLEYKNPRAG